MAKDNDGVWLDDLLCGEKLSGTEKVWRDIYRIADEFYLLVKLNRYPLTAMIPQYKMTVYKVKQKKWITLFEEKGMELEPLLKKVRKRLEEYKDNHKEYILQRPGGGEMI